MKVRVGLFFGGKSVEHEVSVISGIQALQNIDLMRYDVTPVYISKDGAFYTGKDIGNIEAYRDIPALLARSSRTVMARENGRVLLLRYPQRVLGNNVITELDVALPVVHGTNCEDGSLQGFFTVLGLPFAGCDVASSALGMDKFVQKALLKQCGIPVLDAVRLTRIEYESAGLEAVASRFEFPVIAKPVNLGSSVGINVARDGVKLADALDLAFRFSETVIIERAITDLVEVNCSVLGDSEEARASVCEQPLGGGEILSYSDKYMSGSKGDPKSGGMASLGRKIPADIPEELRDSIQSLAVQAFKALGCEGVVRIDFLYDRSSGEVFFNEINTIPGSLAFYLWQASGVSYTEMLTTVLDLAFKRERRNRNLAFSFDTNILAGVKAFGSKGSKGS